MGVGRERWALSVRLEGAADNLTRQRRFHVIYYFKKSTGNAKIKAGDIVRDRGREVPDLVKTVFCLT